MKIIQQDKNYKVYINDLELFNTQEFRYGMGHHKIKENHAHFKIKEKSDINLKDNLEIKIENTTENLLTMNLKVPKEFNRLLICLNSFDSEQIFGGGEQYNHLNLKGKKFPIWVQEQGVGRGWDPISLLTKLKGTSGSWFTTFYTLYFFKSHSFYCRFDSFSDEYEKLQGFVFDFVNCSFYNSCKYLF
jgi:alpha-glucosidase